MFDFYFNIVFVLLVCPNCVRSFGLTQKNQKVKWLPVLFSWKKRTKSSRLRLLSYSVSSFRCARRKLAALRQRRSGRSTSFLRLTLTRTRPIQWIIENWQWTIIFLSSNYQWNRLRGCRGAALLRLITSFHNQMAINKITNEFIMLFVVLSCRLGWRRSTLHLYIHFQFSILHFQFSIDEVVNCQLIYVYIYSPPRIKHLQK